VLYQTQNQDQALSVSVLKAVLLLHQRQFKPGAKVILLRAAPNASQQQGSSSDSSHTPSSAPFLAGGFLDVVPGSLGTVAELQDSLPAQAEVSSVPVLFAGRAEALQASFSDLLVDQLWLPA